MKEENLDRLEDVLTRLERAGHHAQRSKCQFKKLSVTLLGHRVNADGLHLLPEKVGAVVKAPTHPLVSESSIPSWNYCKFLPNLLSVLVSLYHLLSLNTWGTDLYNATARV